MAADNDYDGLNDGDEEVFGTFSTLVDTDFDGYTDGYEAQRLADGFDPATPTKIYSPDVWLNEFAPGMFCGDVDYCRIDSIPWLLGNIASGVLVFGDVRETISGVLTGNWPAAGIAVIGLIPGFGDIGSAGAKVTKAITRSADIVFKADSLRLLFRQVDTTTYLRFIDQLEPGLSSKIRANAPHISDDVLADLVDANGVDRLKSLFVLPSNKLKTPNYSAMSPPAPDLNWRQAETYLQDYVGAPGYKQVKTTFSTGDGTASRYYDASLDGSTSKIRAFEAKSGNACSGRVRNQAANDVAAIAAGKVENVEWHFFVSPWTGRVGPCQTVLNILLADSRISIVMHIPGAP